MEGGRVPVNNRSSGGQQRERRQLPDRREDLRRVGAERREAVRRLTRLTEIEAERREEERRRLQRRGVFDRRSRIARRFSDRSRSVPAPYDVEETEELRRMLSRSSFEVECPRCRTPVVVNEPIDASRPVWEIACEVCNCAATLTATATAVVLLAADDAMIRDAMSLVLAKAGHRVFEAETGDEALRAYRSKLPDLVVVDMTLADMDGIDLMRRLLRFDDQARVIVMSGPRRHGAPDPLAMAKRLGAAHTLRRPFPPNEMLAAVGEALRD